MKRFMFLLIAPLLATAHPRPTDTDPRLQVLKEQVLKDILSAGANEAEVVQLMAAMKDDGSWPDINYADKTRGNWPVNDHLQRLNSMALLYRHKGSKWTNNADLEKHILLGLDYWLKNDFICPNWWYPQIGVPKVLAPIMLLMEDKLSVQEKQDGLKILSRAKIGMTGQNKVWLSGNVIYRSLLSGDIAAIDSAAKAIQEEIVVSEAEGIQPDFSFHQHGTQQQFGNYGSAYAADMLKWTGIFHSTAFAFTPEKVAILRNYLLQGMKWIIWKHKMDISACGRQLFPDAQAGKANAIQGIMSRMPEIDPSFKAQYLSALNDFNGDNHFWRSDMTVHRRDSFYASVKMSSVRVGGAESCNDENVQGYHLGDGATYFYRSNNEYTDIFPYWDWKMIPGTTTFHDDVPLPVLPCSGYNIPTAFSGGVSDGVNGIATLSYNRDSLTAQKSWFFFEDAIVCIGAGLHSDEAKEVRTTVNQSFLNSAVWVKGAGKAQLLGTGEHKLDKTSWVLHDGWGYYFPGSANIVLANREQEGNWHNVVKRMPASTITAGLFTLWFNHGQKPANAKYAYYVFPGATETTIDARAAAFKITSNTPGLQCVENTNLKMAGIVFVKAGEARSVLFQRVKVSAPCVLMLTKKYAATNLSVSDPTHQLSELVITLTGNRHCNNGQVVFNKATNTTAITVSLPQGPEAGKTVQLTLE